MIQRLSEPDPDMVRQLQAALATIGLLRGGANGIVDKITERAVRTLQTRSGLQPDGRITAHLLALARHQARQQQLLERLQSVRLAEMTAARRVLQALQEQTRGGEPPSLAPMPLWPSPGTLLADACSHLLNDPRCLLNEALKSALSVQPQQLKDWALKDIAALQARAGAPNRALTTLFQMSDQRLVLAGLRAVVTAQAEAGRDEEAFALATTLPVAPQRASLLIALARVECARGDPRGQAYLGLGAAIDAVADTLDRISLHVEAASLASWKPHCSGARHHLTVAQDLVRGRADAATRQQAMRLIAGMYIDLGDEALGLSLLESLPEDDAVMALRARAAASEARHGSMKRAIVMAERITGPRYRAQAFGAIALNEHERGDAQAARSNLRTALNAVAQARTDYVRSHLLFDLLLVAFAMGPDLVDVIGDTRRAIADPQLRAILSWIDTAGPKQPNGGVAALESAEAAVTALDTPLQQVWVLSASSRYLAKRGAAARAGETLGRSLDLALSINDAWSRARALTWLAGALLVLGEQTIREP